MSVRVGETDKELHQRLVITNDIIKRVFDPNYKTVCEQKSQLELLLQVIGENIRTLQVMNARQAAIVPIFE